MTTPPTTDLAPIVAFVEAQLQADEAAAKAAAEAERGADWRVRACDHEGISVWAEYDPGDYGWEEEATRHIARHDPARVLAQVAALRAVVALHKPEDMAPWYARAAGTLVVCDECGPHEDVAFRTNGQGNFPCPTLRHIAAIWRGVEGWREEWA